MDNIIKSLLTAAALTVVSYFRGGVKYSSGDIEFPPIWLQLCRIFVIIFVVSICVNSLFGYIERRRNKKRHNQVNHHKSIARN